VFPLRRKKRHFRHFFWMPAKTKILKIDTCIFLTQFPPLEKISQNTISIFFQRCTGHILTIEAVLRSQHRKLRRILGNSPLVKFTKKFWAHFPDFASQNKAAHREVQMHILSYPPSKCTKMFWAHFHDFCVQKRSSLPLNPDAFWRF